MGALDVNDYSRYAYSELHRDERADTVTGVATPKLHRTTVDIEIDAFEEARAVLGTAGYRDTVNTSMREVVRLHKLRQLGDLIRKGELTGFPTPEELHELRHRRTRDIVPRTFAPLGWLPSGEPALRRALEVRRGLARAGHGYHRRPAMDYVIAATAELAGADVVLRAFDRDMQVICEHAGQPCELETTADTDA